MGINAPLEQLVLVTGVSEKLDLQLLLHYQYQVENRVDSAFTTKKWSFPKWISSINVTKSAGNCGFAHIYRRNR